MNDLIETINASLVKKLPAAVSAIMVNFNNAQKEIVRDEVPSAIVIITPNNCSFQPREDVKKILRKRGNYLNLTEFWRKEKGIVLYCSLYSWLMVKRCGKRILANNVDIARNTLINACKTLDRLIKDCDDSGREINIYISDEYHVLKAISGQRICFKKF